MFGPRIRAVWPIESPQLRPLSPQSWGEGRKRPLHRLQRPPVATGSDIGGRFKQVELPSFRPLAFKDDPRSESCGFVLGEFLRVASFGRRHFTGDHSRVEQTLIRFKRCDGGATFTTLQQRFPCREVELPRRIGLAVTFEAPLDEDRRDRFLKRRRCLRDSLQRDGERRDHCREPCDGESLNATHAGTLSMNGISPTTT